MAPVKLINTASRFFSVPALRWWNRLPLDVQTVLRQDLSHPEILKPTLF